MAMDVGLEAESRGLTVVWVWVEPPASSWGLFEEVAALPLTSEGASWKDEEVVEECP